jgi:hypothetical protein
VSDPLATQQRVRRQVLRRRRWQRLRLAVLVVVATAAVIAAAVGIDRLAVAVHKFYAEHHHAAPRATGTTHPVATATATTTTMVGAARCNSTQLSATVSDWRDTGGAVEETVQLTNISVTPCSLDGYPTLGVGGQNGTPLPAPNADVTTVGQPAPAGPTSTTTVPVSTTPVVPVTMVQGARASFQLSYANLCTHVLEPGQPATGVPNECYTGIWLEVTPTAGSTPLIVTEPLRLTYATAGFEVGPFQAGDGVPLTGPPPLTAQTTVASVPATTA